MIKVYSEHGPDFIPERATKKSAGFDIRTPRDIILKPGTETIVDTGLVIDGSEYPHSLFYMLVPRSSAGIKHDIELKNTVGIIDQDYCGPQDTLKVALMMRQPKAKFVGTYSSRIGRAYPFKDGPRRADMAQYSGTKFDTEGFEYFDHSSGKWFTMHDVFELPDPTVNWKENRVVYEKGERFCQMIIMKHFGDFGLKEVGIDEVGENRYGLGSTGNG